MAAPLTRGLVALVVCAFALAPESERVALGGRDWTRDGLEAAPELAGDVVVLPMDGSGVRWATVFETSRPGRARLSLHWEGGPDGLLFEVVLDGERLSPPRDGWRPTRRPLTSDLGPVWLGPGGHLLEFVAREQAPGTVRVVALELEALTGRVAPAGR